MQFSVPDVLSPGAGEIRTGARVRPSTGASLGAMTRRVSRATPLAAAIAALLANGSALALSLGPIEVSSALGEPLRAELPLGVAPGERVTPDCFRPTTDASAGSRGGLPYEASVQLLGNGPARRLAITGRTPLREPLLDLVIAVDCAGAPRMERGYTLMLSPRSQPAQRAPSPTAATPSPTAATPSPTAATPSPTTAAAARPARAQAPAAVTRPDSPLRAGDSPGPAGPGRDHAADRRAASASVRCGVASASDDDSRRPCRCSARDGGGDRDGGGPAGRRDHGTPGAGTARAVGCSALHCRRTDRCRPG